MQVGVAVENLRAHTPRRPDSLQPLKLLAHVEDPAHGRARPPRIPVHGLLDQANDVPEKLAALQIACRRDQYIDLLSHDGQALGEYRRIVHKAQALRCSRQPRQRHKAALDGAQGIRVAAAVEVTVHLAQGIPIGPPCHHAKEQFRPLRIQLWRQACRDQCFLALLVSALGVRTAACRSPPAQALSDYGQRRHVEAKGDDTDGLGQVSVKEAFPFVPGPGNPSRR
mmetsp:Transcript_25836/g.53027  ORF Transcript_25836/g.53027 Transcript_25836/m.53027 type:complete len:225 (+) Transcript_25836:153-827(+)